MCTDSFLLSKFYIFKQNRASPVLLEDVELYSQKSSFFLKFKMYYFLHGNVKPLTKVRLKVFAYSKNAKRSFDDQKIVNSPELNLATKKEMKIATNRPVKR